MQKMAVWGVECYLLGITLGCELCNLLYIKMTCFLDREKNSNPVPLLLINLLLYFCFSFFGFYPSQTARYN